MTIRASATACDRQRRLALVSKRLCQQCRLRAGVGRSGAGVARSEAGRGDPRPWLRRRRTDREDRRGWREGDQCRCVRGDGRGGAGAESGRASGTARVVPYVYVSGGCETKKKK